jgi:hypothetical protein
VCAYRDDVTHGQANAVLDLEAAKLSTEAVDEQRFRCGSNIGERAGFHAKSKISFPMNPIDRIRDV